jgi:CheY-like chemotaxis protein
LHALVIEDEPLVALDLEYQLRLLGVSTVDVAASEIGAIELAKQRCPDLITADVGLQQGSGISAVQAICAKNGTIPVIYVTAQSDRLSNAPADLVVTKPFLPGALRRAFNAAISTKDK